MEQAQRLKLMTAEAFVLPGSEATDGNHASLAKFALGDRVFSMANTHLSWQSIGYQEAHNPRHAQMTQICDSLERMADNQTMFICGDMNDIYTPLRVAHTKLGLLPSFTLAGVCAPHSLPTPSVDIRDEIDYFASKSYDWILCKGVTVLKSERIDYELDGVYPSDHYPVLATCAFDEDDRR